MRSYRIAESAADRARGVVRIERLDYPATTASPAHGAAEYRIALGDILASEHVRVYRQLMGADGTTREFLIDVDGLGLGIVEGGDPRPVEAAGTGPVMEAVARPGRGPKHGSRKAP